MIPMETTCIANTNALLFIVSFNHASMKLNQRKQALHNIYLDAARDKISIILGDASQGISQHLPLSIPGIEVCLQFSFPEFHFARVQHG